VSAFERYLIQLLDSLLLPSDVAQTLLHLPQQCDASRAHSSATLISGLWKMTVEFRWLLQTKADMVNVLYDILTHTEIVLGNTNFGTTPGARATRVRISS
jgi:hypothetical protein